MANKGKLATPKTMYPHYCSNCGAPLCWNSDFNYDEVYHEEIAEGFVGFHSCTNEECGLMYQADYLDELGYVRIIPMGTDEEEEEG